MGLFKAMLGGVDIQGLIEAKDFDGLLKASAKKDPEVKKKAVQAFGSLGESARGFLSSNLGKSNELQNVRSAAVLKELGWVPGTVEERILFLMGLDSWEDLTDLGEEAVAPLKQIIKSRDLGDGIRSAALLAIGQFHESEVAKFIVDDLRESAATNASDAYIAVGCLKRMGTAAVNSLAAVLSDEKSSQHASIWASQTLAMIGPPAVEALIAVNKNPTGTGLKALESWTFSLQALAGTADEKALDHIRNGALQALRDQYAKGMKGLPRLSEEAKIVEAVLDVFKDPPRSILKFVKLGGPMRSYQIIATLASGNRRETQSIKAFSLQGGTGLGAAIFGSPNSVSMDALDKIGGDEATKAMIDFIKSNIGPERRAKAIVMIDKNAHPSIMEYLENYGEKEAFHFLDKAAGALTLIHLKNRQFESSGGTSAGGSTSEGGCG
jgi:hypothetical protein